jgi:uncharacterized protein YbaP (TraB family)
MPGMRNLLSACLRGLAAGALLWGGAASAQGGPGCPPPPPAVAEVRAEAAAVQARDRGMLWRLDKDGRTSWLYGTLHVGRPDWVVPGPTVRSAVLASDVVALELDPADPEPGLLLLAATDPARNQRVLSGLQPQLGTLADRACLPAALLQLMPALVQLMTLTVVEARRDGLHPELGVETALLRMARRTGKRFVALETPAQQIAVLGGASEEDERELVTDGLAQLASGEARELLLRLVRTWAEGDAATLADYRSWCQCEDTPAELRFTRRLNDERNPALADKLAALHAGGERFFAGVGALHMTGPQALTTLLQARGFAVQRVPFPATAGSP